MKPERAHRRVCHARVEGLASEEALESLRRRVGPVDFNTLPRGARLLQPMPEHHGKKRLPGGGFSH